MSIEIFPSAEKYPLLAQDPDLFELTNQPGGHAVWMWRDDPDDFAGGGNKVRFYEYLIPEILRAAPDVLLTTGSRYSNHLRVTALVAARLGLEAQLLVYEDEPEDGALPTENLRLAAEAGAQIRFIGAFAAELRASMIARELKKAGKKVFSVPAGGHVPGAVRAYANVIVEALMALDGHNVRVSRVFLPAASGTTHAGVLCGLSMLSQYMDVPRVTSFAVANTPADAAEQINAFCAEAASVVPELAGLPIPAAEVLDCSKNVYGAPDEELLALRAELKKTDGVLLDRVYNVNAFFGMTRELENDPGDSAVLYLNTGGYVL